MTRLHVFVLDWRDRSRPVRCADCPYEYKHPIHIQKDGEICEQLWSAICTCGSRHNITYEEDVNINFITKISTPGYLLDSADVEIIKAMMEQ